MAATPWRRCSAAAPILNRRRFLLLFTLHATSLGFVVMAWQVYQTAEPPLPLDDAPADKIIVRKSEHRMTLWREGRPLKSYAVALGRGGSGPKMREGDNKVPEGLYRISGRNPESTFYRALRISYPEPSDIASARARGDMPGSDIMIHGIRNGFGWLGALHRHFDWTAGCIAVTDREMDEIWRSVPDGTPIAILP
jgi:murein L,D-transpeptidase YafK